MRFWPDTPAELQALSTWVDIAVKLAAAIFAVVGGGWGLKQYFDTSRLRAAESLLKMEEEFRFVFRTFERLEIPTAYTQQIAPILEAEQQGTVPTQPALETLIELDRALRFLYLCVVLDGTLKGNAGNALRRAYYHYIEILSPDATPPRPALLAYTSRYYPRLTAWIRENKGELANLGTPKRSGLLGRWRRR